MGKIRVDIVGAGLLFAALMLLVKGVPGAKEAVSLAMAQGILWGAVFVGACMVVLQLWRKSYPSLAEDRECACVGFGAVFVAAAAIVAWTGLVPPFAPGVLAGASFSLMGAIWVKECARYAMDDVLLSSSVGLVVAGIAQFAATSLLSPQWYFLAVLVLVGTAAVFFCAARTHASLSSEEIQDDESDAAPPLKQRFSFAAKILWLPVSGAILSVFIFGLTWDPVVSGEIVHSSLPLYEACLFIGPCIAAAVTVAIVVYRSSSAVFLMQGVVLPCAVAVILVLPALGVESAAVQALFQIVQAAGFSAIVLVTWASLVAAVRSVRIIAPAVWCFSLFALATIFGMEIIHVIGLAGKDLCLLLLTVYMALIAVWYALETEREKNARVMDDLRPGAYISRRCDELEESLGISQREKEVLYYLARGYNHGYIARKLFISENTVRTHVRHIYAKLNVNSREGLLDFIDGVDEREEDFLASAER